MNHQTHDTPSDGDKIASAPQYDASIDELAAYFKGLSLIVPAGHFAVGYTEPQASGNASTPLLWSYSYTQEKLGKWKGIDPPTMTFTQGIMVLIGRIPERGLLGVVTKTSLETTVTALLRAAEFLQAAMGTAVKMALKRPLPAHESALEIGLVHQQNRLD